MPRLKKYLESRLMKITRGYHAHRGYGKGHDKRIVQVSKVIYVLSFVHK